MNALNLSHSCSEISHVPNERGGGGVFWKIQKQKTPQSRGFYSRKYQRNLDICNFHNFVFNFTLWGLNFYFIAFAFAQKATRDRRVH